MQYITEACVRTVLQQSTDSPLCLEPLQLLCSMLSRRAGHTLNMQTSGFLHPHLPTLYRRCCMTLEDHSAEIVSGSISAQKHAANMPQHLQVEDSECGDLFSTSDVGSPSGVEGHVEKCSAAIPCKRSRTDIAVPQKSAWVSSGIFQSADTIEGFSGTKTSDMEYNLSQNIVLSSVARSRRNKIDRYPSGESEDICEGNDRQSSSQKHCSLTQQSDQLKLSPNVKDGIQLEVEKQPHFQHTEPDSCVAFQSTSADINHDSRQAEYLHYMFLCLMQKIAKLVNSLDEPEKSCQLESLNSILTQLVADHAPSFSKDFTRSGHVEWCRERKFLDVLDTILSYSSLRTQNSAGSCAREKLAIHFVRCFHASGCSWSFPSQHTFIGGCHRGQGQGQGSGSEAEREKLDWLEDENRSPVLVLLLVVVLKCCVTVLKTAGQHNGEFCFISQFWYETL